MKTPKYSVRQKVLFRGQNYSLKGPARKIAIVKNAEWNADAYMIIYDIYVIEDKEMSHNCYEDMLYQYEG